MIIAMAGLPGTGKSTLAAALAERFGGRILCKDSIREAMFGADVDYSTAQDDLCMGYVYDAMAYLLKQNPARLIIIDGRTFTRQGTAEVLVQRARELQEELLFVVCESDEEIVRNRLDSGPGEGYDGFAGSM